MAAPVEADNTTFALQVLSHSVGIAETLSFPELPVSTTITQLKTKIKQKARYANADEESQRLIYQGRILSNGEQTMTEVFGAETVCPSHNPHSVCFTDLKLAQELAYTIIAFIHPTSSRCECCTNASYTTTC